MPPFVIFSLPRSRSTWLSRFLTHGDWVCGHDELRHMRSLDDIKAWFSQPCIGTAETAAAPWWRLLDRFAPDARVLIVRRPVDEVVDSLMRLPRLNLDRDRLVATMTKHDRKLDQIAARVTGALSVAFDDLADEATCARVFVHCLQTPFDPVHWGRWAIERVDCDMRAMMRHFAAYRPTLEKLAAVATHRTRTILAMRRPIATDGMTFQTETFEDWVRDGQALADEHLVQVGEAPGDWKRKNLPLMGKLYAAGAMQIVTARANGRMFGYLMTVLGPSLESRTGSLGVHTTFFASPDTPGLGLKLQRAALAELKARGIDEVHWQIGVRGSGEKIGVIPRRLGAESAGEVFRLQLSGVN